MTDARLDHPTVRRWAGAAVGVLESCRSQIDAANVFPVADSDTGTNLLLTLRGGLAALDAGTAAEARTPLEALAHGALVSARGNSGIILSEFLRGFASCLADGALPLEAGALAQAIVCGADRATAAVAMPVEGTILTAARSAGQSALHAAEVSAGGAAGAGGARSAGVANVLEAACAGSRGALVRSPAELSALARAGVLDAGAYGFTLVLEALREVLVGGAPDAAMPELGTAVPGARTAAHPPEAHAQQGAGDQCEHDSALDGDVEVMFVMHDRRPGDHARALRERLSAIGGSVVVVGGDGTWQAHVHTDDPAAAVVAAPGADVRQICVRHLVAQVTGEETLRGVVAGVVSPGLLLEVARTGAVVLHRTGGPWEASELTRVIEDTGSGHVAVLVRADAAAAVVRAQDSLGAAVPSLDVVTVANDLDVVVALTAAVESGVSGQDAVGQMRAALARAWTAEVTAAEATHVLAAAAPSDAPEVVLALWDDDAPAPAREQVRAAAGERWPAAEVVDLASGLPGDRVILGLAW